MTQIADRYRNRADRFEARVRAVDPDRWTNQSPCEEWDARGVVRHIVDVHGMMLGLIGRKLSEAPSVDDDPLAAFQAARADMELVVGDPAVVATEYDGYFGRTNIGDTVDRFLGMDLVIHGWDLARATGQDERIDPAELDRIAAQIVELGDNLHRPGVCGPAVELNGDATEQERLLAALGRDPR